MARMLGDAFVVISPDTTGFRTSMDAQVRRAMAGFNPNVKIGASFDGRAALAAMTALEARLKTLSQGRVALADIIDLNVPQGQIVSQLLLLRRMIQQTGLSDMLGVNLNDAEIKAQLEKISRLSANIEIGANTGSAGASIASLEARIKALSDRLATLRLNADDTQAEAVIARLQARLAALSDKVSNLVITADTTQLDAKIAAETAKWRALQQQVSDLQLDANDKALLAKIETISKQIRDLYARADKSTIDADVTTFLTKIYALEAQVKVLQANAQNIKMAADATALNAAIAASETKIAAMKAEAADIKLGGNVDTTGLAAADAQVLALQAATDKLTASADGAGRAWGNFNAGLITGGWGGAIAGIGLWHIALDGLIEGLIVAATTTLALGAAAAAVYPGFDQLGIYLKSSLNAMTALGVDAGPLAGKLDNLQKAMAPQAIEAYGGALQLVNGQTGILNKIAPQIVDDLQGWIAKLDLWAAGQRDMSGLLETGLTFLNQLLKILGTLGQAIDNLLTKDPGVAHFLLDFVQGIADLIDIFSKLPAPIVEATLALHGIYLWSKVLVVAPLLSFAQGLGILSKAQVDAAKSALSLKGILGLLGSGNVWAWTAVGVIAIGALVYELFQASSQAKTLISNMNTGLSQLNASQAIGQISVDIGTLRAQIQTTQVATGQLVTGLTDSATGVAKSFAQTAKTPFWTPSFWTGLGKSILGAAKTFTGFQEVGPQLAQNGNDVNAYTGEIEKLTTEQSNLFQTTGYLIHANNGLSVGALSVSQAFSLMNIAGVQASDSYAVMVQKVQNLVHGYDAMSISSGVLNNSVNALTFSTLQQDSKVTQLNQAWDSFFSMVSGGETSFTQFATQATGLYQSLGQVADQVRVSSGKVTISLGQQGAAATTSTATITGLNAASLNARNTFLQTAGAANTQLDSLTLLASAAGMGSKGTDLLTQATKDMLAEMLPAAQGSQAMTDILYALAQRGGYQGADSFKALATWVGNTKDPMTNLDGIVTTLTTNASNLTTDVKNLSDALGQTLNQAMATAIFQASGGQQVFDNFATAIMHTQFNSQQDQDTALALGQSIYNLTGNVADAQTQFISFAEKGLNLNQAQAEQLWNEIVGKLTPSLNDQANNVLPGLQTSFENWANQGLNYSKSQADNLWSQITGKLGPSLSNMGDLTVPSAKNAFIDWAENGLKLSQSQAETLWGKLVTLQGQINSMHGTNIPISSTLSGSGTINVDAQAGTATAQGDIRFHDAAGGLIDLGTGPTADDVHAMLSKGEYVVQASSVAKYGVGMMEKINAGQYAGGGLIGSYDSLDSQLGAMPGALGVATANAGGPAVLSESETVVNALTALIKSDLAQQAKAAAAAAASASGGISLAGVSNQNALAALQSAAAKAGWTGAEWTALEDVEMREAGFSLTATNPSSGAYGLAQFINGPGEYAQYGGNSTTAAGQATAMVNYIKQRYGDPEAAWQHELNYGWYGHGGLAGFASGGIVGDQAAELADYYAFSAGFTNSLKNPAKGSWLSGHKAGILSELGTLAKRQSTEEAAYDAVRNSSGASARVSHYSSTLSGLLTVLKDQDLSYGGSGGQPSRLRTLISAINTLRGLKYPGALGGSSAPASKSTKATSAVMNALIGKGGPGEVLPAPIPVLASYFASNSALTSALSSLKGTEQSTYFGLGHSFQIGFGQNPVKGTWLYNNRGAINRGLTTLAARHQATVAALNVLTGAGLTAQNLTSLGTAAQAETDAAMNPIFSAKQLSPNWAGGHPLWNQNLRLQLAGLISIANSTGGGARLPVLPPVTDTIGQAIALSTVNLGQAGGGLIGGASYDKGGYLPPGLSLAWNGTGSPEAVGSGMQQTVQVELCITGGDQELTTLLRKIVKVKGGGSVQRALGLPGAH